MEKYQFIVHLENTDYDLIENELKDIFNVNDDSFDRQFDNVKENCISILNQWDYGEYTEKPLTYDEFINDIGTNSCVSTDIYFSSKSDYVLVTYGFLSAMSLYKVIKE